MGHYFLDTQYKSTILNLQNIFWVIGTSFHLTVVYIANFQYFFVYNVFLSLY